MYKVYFFIIPDVLEKMFIQNTSVHDHDTRQARQFHSNKGILEPVKRSVRVQGVRHWNFMMSRVDHFCSPHSYKNQIKRYLLANNINIT